MRKNLLFVYYSLAAVFSSFFIPFSSFHHHPPPSSSSLFIYSSIFFFFHRSCVLPSAYCVTLSLDNNLNASNPCPTAIQKDNFLVAKNLNSMSSQATSYASAFWTERDRNFKVDTRHYGDLESLRTNVTYALSALAVSTCFIIFTKLLEKRTIKAGYNAIRAISFVALVTLIFNLLRPATKLSVEQLKNSEMLLNSCVNSVKVVKIIEV